MRAAPWVLVLAIGCDRGHPRERAPAPPPTTAAASTPAAVTPSATAAAGPRCTLAPIPLRLPPARRVVAIGDLHGDLAATRAALRAAGAIDAQDRWSGGDLVVVQTGDILDRGDEEQAILDLLFGLVPQAKEAGGAMVLLLGNHELMNAAGDLRYVTAGGMRDFDDVPGLELARWSAVPAVARGRIAALAPGGVYARQLARNNVVAIVGDTVFSHAGVLGDWCARVDAVNLEARCWLDGQAGGLDAPPPVLVAEDSPVWTRALGGEAVDCAQAAGALAALGARRMVVGHTVQPHISSACDDTVWRIDVGLGKNYGGPIEVLELAAEAPPKILRGDR